MTYGQVIFILFVVLIGYYGFLIFMDIQYLKAAEAAAQGLAPQYGKVFVLPMNAGM